MLPPKHLELRGQILKVMGFLGFENSVVGSEGHGVVTISYMWVDMSSREVGTEKHTIHICVGQLSNYSSLPLSSSLLSTVSMNHNQL